MILNAEWLHFLLVSIIVLFQRKLPFELDFFVQKGEIGSFNFIIELIRLGNVGLKALKTNFIVGFSLHRGKQVKIRLLAFLLGIWTHEVVERAP